MRSAAIALLLVGCLPQPVIPPPDVGGTCATARETAVQLGGCDVDTTTFVSDCEERSRAYADANARFPVGCMTASKSCDEFWACR